MEWKKGQGTSIFVERHPVRAMALKAGGQQDMRFIVEASRPSGANILVESGCTQDVEQAMKLAETAVERQERIISRQQTVIMVVDDDAATRRDLAEVLQTYDCRVVEASSGEGALRRLDRMMKLDVLITARNLGDRMDGQELVQAVHDLFPATCIVLSNIKNISMNIVAGVALGALRVQSKCHNQAALSPKRRRRH